MPPNQPDFFGAPQPNPPGLALSENIITPAEEQSLIASIDAAALSPFRFHGWLGKRLTLSFGWSYDFQDGSFQKTDPIPPFLHALQARAAKFANLPTASLEQAILIRYDPGSGIGWHRDRPVFDHVIGISLGAQATMRFRRRIGPTFKRAAALLPPRSIYHLSSEARQIWEHSIAPINAPRWSITFRTLTPPP